MKAIFLDVDGVLVNRASFSKELRALRKPGDTLTPFHPDCVANLNRITDATGARLILSSTWRLGMKLIDAREFFLYRGIKEPLMDFTPRLIEQYRSIFLAQPRGKEIQAWIDNAREIPESFVILDDDADMEHLAPKLVQTRFEDGLTASDAERCIAALLAVGGDK